MKRTELSNRKVVVLRGAPSKVLNVASSERLIYSTKAVVIAARLNTEEATRAEASALFLFPFDFPHIEVFLSAFLPFIFSSFSWPWHIGIVLLSND